MILPYIEQGSLVVPQVTQIEAVVSIDSDGEVAAHGTALIRPVTTAKTIVYHARSDGATASCANTDDNPRAGLANVAVRFEAHDGDALLATISPVAGDIDESGEHEVDLRVQTPDGTVIEYRVQVKVTFKLE